MSKHAFGLDISDTSIEAFEIKKKFGKLTVVTYGRVELSSGIVDNGRILNKEKLIEAVKKFTDSGRFSTKNVIVAIPESKTFIHVFKLPAVISDDSLGESIQYEAEETIPLSFDKAYHDYQVIAREDDSQEVLYVASFKETVDSYREIITEAGLNPIVFETESLSLVRALAQDDEFEGVLIVDIGARTTIITVFDHYGVRYSENMAVAGNSFTKKIARSFKINEAEAEKLKREVGFTKPDTKSQGRSAPELLVMEIVEEITKAIAYYQKKTDFVINKIILCGGTSLMPGLVDYISKKMEIKVELGNPLSKLNYSKNAFQTESPVLYSTAVGLALRGISTDQIQLGINLLAYEKGKKKTKFSQPADKKPASKFVKKEKKDKPQPPKGTSEKKRIKVLAIIFSALVLIFAGIFFWQRTRGDEPLISFVDSSTSVQPVNQGATNINTNQLNNFQVELAIYTIDTENKPADSITGRQVEQNITKTVEINTTGTKTVNQAATGTIKIINNYSADQPLVVTTRFLAPDQTLFRLTQGVVVPAGGDVEAEVYADQSDWQGEVAAAKFTIPGLSQSLQEYIYGESVEPIVGGSQEVSYVLETDIQTAEEELEQEINNINISELGISVSEGESLFPQALLTEVQKKDFSEQIGSEAESVSLEAEIRVLGLIFSQDGLTEEFNKKLADQDQTATDYEFNIKQYNLISFDQESGIVIAIFFAKVE